MNWVASVVIVTVFAWHVPRWWARLEQCVFGEPTPPPSARAFRNDGARRVIDCESRLRSGP